MRVIEDYIEKMIDLKVEERMAENNNANCLESDPNRFMTINETAEYLKVSVRSIHNYFKSGVLTKIYFGDSPRVDKMEIIAFADLQRAS